MRRTATLIVTAALGGAGAVVALGAAPAVAAPAAASTLTTLDSQVRMVDTRYGGPFGNHLGAVHGGSGITPLFTGPGSKVPTTATAVVVSLTASAATAGGGLTVYAAGHTRPGTTALQFTTARSVTNTAIIPLSSAGRGAVFNTASGGSVHVLVDVSGYYAPTATPGGGVYHGLSSSVRLVDTTTGAFGNHHGAVPAHQGILPRLSQGEVPASADSVAVTITAINAKKSGTIFAYRLDEPRNYFALVHFVAGQRVSAFAVLRLQAGRVAVVNNSGGTVDIRVDVAGYYDAGSTTSAGQLKTVVPKRVYAAQVIPGNTTITLTLAGKGGAPGAGNPAYLVTLHAAAPARSGGLQIYRPSDPSPAFTKVLRFRAHETASNVVFAPASGGQVKVHNASDSALTIVVDLDGYVT